MPSAGPPDLSATLGRLRERFLATSGETVAIFADLAERLAKDPVDREALEVLHRELHRTHGTAGSYGFHAASRGAGALEAVAARWVTDPAHEVPRRAAIVSRFAEALQRAFAGDLEGRRLLLVGFHDAQVVPLVCEALHRGYTVERVAPAALADAVREGPRAFAGILAAADATLPPIEGVAVIRLGDGADAAQAITSCCGPPP